MQKLVDVPITKAGKWKRKMHDAMRELTGMAFCASCQQNKPADQVKRYRPMNPRPGYERMMTRCDACQARRQEYLKSRKT